MLARIKYRAMRSGGGVKDKKTDMRDQNQSKKCQSTPNKVFNKLPHLLLRILHVGCGAR